MFHKTFAVFSLTLITTISAQAQSPIVIGGVGLFTAAVAAEAHHWWSGPKSDDPKTLDEAVAAVKKMRESGASTDDIARFVTGVSDRRLTNANSAEAVVFLWSSGERQKRFDRHGSEREYHGMTSREYNRHVHPSDATQQALWAWNLGIGNCNEHRSISYYILLRAGLAPRLASVAYPHDFTVIGLAPNAKLSDPSTWGPEARIVDGWSGKTLTSEEAAHSKIHGSGGGVITDQTDIYGQPEKDAAWELLAGKGIARVRVVSAADGKLLRGIVASASGARATTDANGRADLTLPVGEQAITFTAPAGSRWTATSAAVKIEEQAFSDVTVSLTPAEPDHPVVAPPANVAPVGRASRLSGSGSIDYPLPVSGDVKIAQKTGSIILTLEIDPVGGTISGSLAGNLSAVLVPGQGERMNVRSRMAGPVHGKFIAASGRLEGTVDVVETSFAPISSSANGQLRLIGTLAGGEIDVTLDYGDERLKFRFGVRKL